MQQYDAYKDSGVEWIGEIPEGWDLRRISSLYDARNEKVSDQDYPALSVTMQGIVPQLETAAKTQDGDNRKLVKVGDFVINSRSDRRGACGISDFDGSVTLISNVLAPKNYLNMQPRYYSYLFRSEGFADEYYRQGTGIVDDLWSTNWSRMKNILVACPPLGEQEAIADFLDAKTAEIDALMADCEREVELLQEYRKAVISEAVTKGLDPTVAMKDSGVEWVGRIPEGWLLSKLRYCGSIQNGISKSSEYFGTGYPFISYGNVYRDELGKPELFGRIESSQEEQARYSVKRGDILFTRTSETIDEVGIAAGALTDIEKSCFAGFLMRFRPYPDVLLLPEYAAYYFRSDIYRQHLTREMVLVTRASLGQQLLGGITVLLPPLPEQRAIADYLDVKTAEIDSIIADKRTLIDKLREYRKSLISETVTGKFKVPGV